MHFSEAENAQGSSMSKHVERRKRKRERERERRRRRRRQSERRSGAHGIGRVRQRRNKQGSKASSLIFYLEEEEGEGGKGTRERKRIQDAGFVGGNASFDDESSWSERRVFEVERPFSLSLEKDDDDVNREEQGEREQERGS